MDGEQGSLRDANHRIVEMVCTANRGRSVIAAALLQRALAARGIDGIDVRSGGMCVYELGFVGKPANENAQLVATRHGLDISGHRAAPITMERLALASLVLTSEVWQRDVLRHMARSYIGDDAPERVLTLRELDPTADGNLDLADVYGQGPQAVEHFLHEAERCIAAGLASDVFDAMPSNPGAPRG